MSLGARRSGVCAFLFAQLIFLGLLAAVMALAGAWLLLPAFPWMLKGLVPEGIVLNMDLVTAGMALGLGGLGSLVFCLPVLVNLLTIKPLLLLQGRAAEKGVNPWWRAAAFLPGGYGLLPGPCWWGDRRPTDGCSLPGLRWPL